MPPAKSLLLPDRVLLHVTPLRRIVVVPDHVYLLEADRDDTIVRKRGRRTIRDVRPLGKVVLQPPVNRVLPVSRARLPGLLSRFADKV